MTHFRAIYQQNLFIQPQIVTLKRGENIKYFPYAFTEQGVAMVRRGADQTNSRDDPAGVQGNALQGDPTYRMPKGSWDNSLLGK